MEMIAGPALRHVSREEINIWLMVNEQAQQIEVEIVGDGPSVLGSLDPNSANAVQVGQNAFVYLLKATPVTSGEADENLFPVNELLYYDVKFDNRGFEGFELVSGARGITYDGAPLPSLILKDVHQVILQGSCRKPHGTKSGKTQPDQMLAADHLVERHLTHVNERPSMMFLTGDQIYADDVSAPMLALVREMENRYIGHPQKIRLDNGKRINLSGRPLNKRAKLLTRDRGFTSENKANHLISFGEYLMMYCAVWGGRETRCPPFDDVRDDLISQRPARGRGGSGRLPKKTYDRDRQLIEQFLATSWRVRRLMANTPTYMILDDHEVTDDWNLDEDGRDKLRNDTISRYIQTNALAAYWLCQGWGNNPQQKEFVALRVLVPDYFNGYVDDNFDACNSLLFDIYWGYEINTIPYTVVMDTRTRRVYNRSALARLMNDDRLDTLATTLKNVPRDTKQSALLLVSPAPVLGFKAVEKLQLFFVGDALEEPSGARMLDVECWIADKQGFEKLMSVIANSGFGSCAIFSGDVHYGFCRHQTLQSTGGRDVRVFQLTSSSLHNAPGRIGSIGLGLLGAMSTIFERYNSPYMLPSGNGEDFIKQETNIGVLRLGDGRLEQFILDSSESGGDDDTWVYDLANPKRVVLGGGDTDYDDDDDELGVW